MKNISIKGNLSFSLVMLCIGLCYLISTSLHASSNTSDLTQCKPFPKSLANQYQHLSLKQFQLENGLRIIVIPADEENFFTMRLVYGVGSRDEKNGQSGYAHLVEHLMFKGTELLKDGEYQAQIQQAGGISNASTDYDKTDYWSQLPLNYLERAIWMEASRMRGLRLNQQSLDNQLQAVKEEKALRLTNQPYLNPVSRFIISEWKNTPYNQLLIGSDADLDAATLEKMESWLAQYSHPANAVIAFTGNLNPNEIKTLVEKYFSDIPTGHKRQPIKPFELVQQAKSVELHDSKAPWPVHAFAWQVPGFEHKDSVAIRLVNDILFDQKQGLIYQKLIDQQLAFTVLRLDYAFQYLTLANAIIIPHSYVSKKKIQNIVEQTLSEIKITGVSKEKLCQVVNLRSKKRLTALNSSFSRIAEISNNLLLHNDVLYGQKQLQQLLNMTPKDVQRILQQYYGTEYLLITVEPDWPTRWLKSILEILPDGVGRSLEKDIL
jgi:predicted Zn-dependent peptidase